MKQIDDKRHIYIFNQITGEIFHGVIDKYENSYDWLREHNIDADHCSWMTTSFKCTTIKEIK